MHDTTFNESRKTLSPDDRERLTIAYHAARLRCGLATEPSGPVSMAGRFVKLLRRLGVAR